jgi:putative ABC transport system substrate-binding protein
MRMLGCLRMLVLALVVGVTTIGRAPAADSARPRIAVLVSHDAAPYRDAMKGFQQALVQRGVDAALDVVALQGDGRKVAVAMQKAKHDGAALVFTIGMVATQAALAENSDLPVVAGLILNADVLARATNATGVMLEMPLDLQFEWMQRLLPTHKTVGVLYNPAENRKRVEEAGRAARSKGLRLLAHEVDTPHALPAALDAVAKEADMLWAIADTVVVSPETAKSLLVASFRNRIPFIGLSGAWVKAGALFALDWDYEDVGAQCGEAAVKVLKGARAGSIGAMPARRVTYALNLKTAREMRIVLSEPLIQGAAQVFE